MIPGYFHPLTTRACTEIETASAIPMVAEAESTVSPQQSSETGAGKQARKSPNNHLPAERGMISADGGWHDLGTGFQAVAAIGEDDNSDAFERECHDEAMVARVIVPPMPESVAVWSVLDSQT